MSASCRTDPVVCIDSVALFIGEFLKDWTTLGMLALLLGLLLKLRHDQHRAREAAYAEQMAAYDKQRQQSRPAFVPTWDLDKPGGR